MEPPFGNDNLSAWERDNIISNGNERVNKDITLIQAATREHNTRFICTAKVGNAHFALLFCRRTPVAAGRW